MTMNRHMLGSAVRFAARRSAPISIGCTVTHRCNLHCAYCDFPCHVNGEMDTAQWQQAIAELARAGTMRFGFSGGEPLLRDDMPQLLRAAQASGAKTTLCTNGILAVDRMPELDALDMYTTSLDGASAPIHDKQRKRDGAFAYAMAGIEAALGAGMEVKTLTVVTPHNIDQVEPILAIADEMGFKAGFQPATSAPLASVEVASLAPEPEAFHSAVRFLMAARAAGRNVLSSDAALQAMLRYPERLGSEQCGAAGRYFGYVDPQGNVFPCHLEYSPTSAAKCNGREKGYAQAFAHCRENAKPCAGCYIVPLVEMNSIFSLRPSAIWEQVRQMLPG